MCKPVNKKNYDKINFIYRDEKGIHSPYFYFRGLKSALERNGLLYYAVDAKGDMPLDLKALLRYPVLCITGSHEPIFEIVKLIHEKQFIAEINPESLHTRQGDLEDHYFDKVRDRSKYFDIYFCATEVDLNSYWGKPCYWLPSWVHTEILDDIAPAVYDQIGFIGLAYRRKGFFLQDNNRIVLAVNTIPRDDSRENVVELCKLINKFKILVNPISSVSAGMTGKTLEYMACKRLSLCQFDQATMFKMNQLFEDGKDIVFFNTFEEMEDKYKYYIKNQDKMDAISLNGYRKVRMFHNSDVRAQRLASIVLHHANGGKYNESFNDITLFTNKSKGEIFPVQSQIDEHKTDSPVPFMHETEIKAICCCFKIFHKPINVLEWGSGNSTTYFSEYLPGGSAWHSVEHNPKWAAHVQSLIDKLECQNIHLHHVPCIGEFQEGSGDGCLETFRNYVLFPIELKKRFKIVIVDGRARIHCLKVGWQLLDNNGVMILHDAQRKQYNSGIPDECYWLRTVNPDVICEGKISTIFIAKSHDVIKKIKILIRKVLPDSIEISNNIDGNGEIENEEGRGNFLKNETNKLLDKNSNGFLMPKAEQLNQQGEELFNKGDITGALTAFTKAIEIDSSFATAYNNLGVIYWQTGEAQKAIDHFKRVLKIDPNDQDAILNYGNILTDLGKIEDARNLYLSYLQRNRKDEEILSALETLERKKTNMLCVPKITQQTLSDENKGFLPFMNELEILAIVTTLRLFKTPISVLEWGSGNSTLYFPQFISSGSEWDSVEHNQEWANRDRDLLEKSGYSNVMIHFVPTNITFQEELMDGDFETFKDYVLYPKRLSKIFKLILVDGRARVECMNEGWRLLDNDGVMILHDAQRKEYDKGIPDECYWVRMVNPLINSEGNLSTLFMAKSLDMIRLLHKEIKAVLPENIIISHNIPKLQNEVYNKSTNQSQAVLVTKPGEDPHGGLSENNKMKYPKVTDQTTHSCIFLNTYYHAFITNHYHKNPSLASLSYMEQKHSLQSEYFGDSDFYSEGLKKAGLSADDLIINCNSLQRAWAKENGYHGDGLSIAVEQIRRLRPDVVYLQDLSMATRELIEMIRPHSRLIVGQIASPLPTQAYIKGLDIIMSSFPHFVKHFRAIGITSYYQPLAFDPRVLSSLDTSRRDISVSFVGGISGVHAKGTQLLEYLASTTPIEFWGYGASLLSPDSPVRARHHGEVWGREMFHTLARSAITVNRHIDVAENFANNMRLFEATGCGTLLITDYKDNLNELYEIGKEVVAYRSPEECAALINYYLAHPEEAATIASAGQRRTLRDHTYSKRMEQTAEILERHLRYKREKNFYPLPDFSRISYGYSPISISHVTAELTSAWQNPGISARQRSLVQYELAEMYAGKPVVPFNVLAAILSPVSANGVSVLEIGCASGYYYEVLEYLLNRRISYTGVDYSQPMIDMARDYYPKASFFTVDGANLFFADRQFSIVISSGILLHVPNYRQHIFETARVADWYVVASRTPICHKRPTQYLKKFAYDVETVELIFNEEEVLREFAINGFKLIQTVEYFSNQAEDKYEATYLFKRV